ncbi:hypothetical protein LEMLEM_LOCUS19863 [Lemmus lemmus]
MTMESMHPTCIDRREPKEKKADIVQVRGDEGQQGNKALKHRKCNTDMNSQRR